MKKYTAKDLLTFERNEQGRLICPGGDYTAIKFFPENAASGHGAASVSGAALASCVVSASVVALASSVDLARSVALASGAHSARDAVMKG